jgi:hypothetical protein
MTLPLINFTSPCCALEMLVRSSKNNSVDIIFVNIILIGTDLFIGSKIKLSILTSWYCVGFN